MLVNELKKIEARKKERDRKTQDLQKLISQADQVNAKAENDFFSQNLMKISLTARRSSTKST